MSLIGRIIGIIGIIVTIVSIVVTIKTSNEPIVLITEEPEDHPIQVDPSVEKPKRKITTKLTEILPWKRTIDDYLNNKEYWSDQNIERVLTLFNSDNIQTKIYKKDSRIVEAQRPSIRQYLRQLKLNKEFYSKVEVRDIQLDDNSKIIRISVNEYSN